MENFNTDFLKYPIEERIRALIPFSAALFTGLSTLEGFYLKDITFIIAGAASTAIFILCYLLTRAKMNFELIAWLMVINTLLLANVVWFRFEGSHGASTVMFMTILFSISLFFNKRRAIGFTLVIINLFMLLFIEYRYPVFIKPYDNQLMRITDMFITFSVCGVFIVLIIQCLLKSYYREKARSEQLNRLKNEFLSNISHELRTPMNAIIGFTGLMEQSQTTPEERKSYVRFVADSCNRLTRMVEDIIEISQIHANEKKIRTERCNISELLQQIYEYIENSPERKEKKDIALILEDSRLQSEVIIETDPGLLEHVLTILLNNAFKFTKNGFVKFGYIKRNSHIEFFVKDTGIGIPENDKELIFESFTKGHHDTNEFYHGVGLGLALSKRILELLFGKIWVESSVNQGSTFYFTLPYSIRE